MQRKQFLTTLAPLGLALAAKSANTQSNIAPPNKIPPYLKKGDTIGITCPAGYLTLQELLPAQQKLEEWGFTVLVGKTVGTRSGTFAATDAERKADLQQMLDDKNIKAILCGRGGYGCNRIIDDLDFTKFKASPKWMIGFSDITLLHTHLNSTLGIASLHSKMCNSFLSDWSKGEPLQIDSINSIKDGLLGKKMNYTAIPSEQNVMGIAEGDLIGGNLSIIYSAMRTKSELKAAGKILFLEEVDERLYSIDRMMWNLKRTGILASIKGLIIGGFRVKPSDKPEDEFAETVTDIVHNLTKEYMYPICFDFPVGHQKVNYALKCGVRHRLIVNSEKVILNEL